MRVMRSCRPVSDTGAGVNIVRTTILPAIWMADAEELTTLPRIRDANNKSLLTKYAIQSFHKKPSTSAGSIVPSTCHMCLFCVATISIVDKRSRKSLKHDQSTIRRRPAVPGDPLVRDLRFMKQTFGNSRRRAPLRRSWQVHCRHRSRMLPAFPRGGNYRAGRQMVASIVPTAPRPHWCEGLGGTAHFVGDLVDQ